MSYPFTVSTQRKVSGIQTESSFATVRYLAACAGMLAARKRDGFSADNRCSLAHAVSKRWCNACRCGNVIRLSDLRATGSMPAVGSRWTVRPRGYRESKHYISRNPGRYIGQSTHITHLSDVASQLSTWRFLLRILRFVPSTVRTFSTETHNSSQTVN